MSQKQVTLVQLMPLRILHACDLCPYFVLINRLQSGQPVREERSGNERQASLEKFPETPCLKTLGSTRSFSRLSRDATPDSVLRKTLPIHSRQ